MEKEFGAFPCAARVMHGFALGWEVTTVGNIFSLHRKEPGQPMRALCMLVVFSTMFSACSPRYVLLTRDPDRPIGSSGLASGQEARVELVDGRILEGPVTEVGPGAYRVGQTLVAEEQVVRALAIQKSKTWTVILAAVVVSQILRLYLV